MSWVSRKTRAYALLQEDAKSFFEFTTKQGKEAETLFAALAKKQCLTSDFETFLKKLLPDPTKPATAGNNPSVRRAYETRLETVRANRKAVMGVHIEGTLAPPGASPG